jgi:Uma2 family endonuclease
MRRMNADRRVTYAEMLEWPDDGRRYELYDGEAIVVPSPFARHQRVASNILDLLRDYADETGGLTLPAPLDIVFSEHNVVQPDVVFFSGERRHLVKDWEVTRSAPDLAVEVLSESTESRDRGRKMELLARYGVPEYWIVEPAENTIEVYVLAGAAYQLRIAAARDETITSPTLSALTFSTARLFAR